ncbi:acyl-CoA thioester hydrolase/BAAT C-terminal domain-containing protein [Microbacterium oleivorans]|uniref:acyl-CoA thioester hydrolase/BAAT C-terminal domain-containing protein n=1 Tax=Microbacterium oleivorans TaxID=273677 RepID=UPI0021162750|nr:acyl-CoA thioester hydrolase/BAAT C-terminal domain-containing protein [Microbacterium oleivorans]
MGTSFGSEAALLTGSHSGDIAGVIAFAPSDVVWAGYDEQRRETSHWTLGHAPVPYLPFDWDGYVKETPARFRPLYERSRATFSDGIAAASIPVERIQRLVLVAGGDDQVWPSVPHAENIRSRRASVGLATALIVATRAGHRTILPGERTVTGGAPMLRGGTEAEDKALGARAWNTIETALRSAR